MAGWERRRIADLESIPGCDPDEPTGWIPLRNELGIEAFGINAFIADRVGQMIIERHDEAGGHEEVYVVLQGAVDMVIDGEAFQVSAGEIVFVGQPELQREGRAAEAPALVLAIGAQPGVTFEPSAWELRELKKNGRL
jgi:hypothetical protein